MIVIYKTDTREVIGVVPWGHDFEDAKGSAPSMKGITNRLEAERLGFRFYHHDDRAEESEAIRARGAVVLEETRELTAEGFLKPTGAEVKDLQAALTGQRAALVEAESHRDSAATRQETADWEITAAGLREAIADSGRRIAWAGQPTAKTAGRVAGIAPPESP